MPAWIARVSAVASLLTVTPACFRDPGLGTESAAGEAASGASGSSEGETSTATTSPSTTAATATTATTTSSSSTATTTTTASTTDATTTAAGTASATTTTTAGGTSGDPLTGDPAAACADYCAKLETCNPGQSPECMSACEAVLASPDKECAFAFAVAFECVLGASCDAIGQGSCQVLHFQAQMICDSCVAELTTEGNICKISYTCGGYVYAILCGAESCACQWNNIIYETCEPIPLCDLDMAAALDYASACCGWVV